MPDGVDVTAAWIAAAVIGLLAAWRASTKSPPERVVLALLPAAVVALLAQLAIQLAVVPDNDMGASRTVPGVALARGFPVYAGPDGGPIIDFMYGPLAAVAFVPAALASTPSGALAIAAAVNLAVFFLPMLWLHAVLVTPARLAMVAMLVFGLLVLRDPGLRFSATSIHADAPSLGLGALACLAVLRSRPRFALSALCAACAVWTKQTAVPLLVALPLWVLVTGGMRRAVVYVGWLVAALLATSLVLVAAFDARDMLFNMVTLPGRMPWYDEATRGRVPAAMRSLGWLLSHDAFAALVLAASLVLDRAHGGGVRGRPALLLALVAIAMAPLAVVGGAKVGGYLNTHSVTNYFLVAAATCAVGTVASHRPATGAWVLAAVLAYLVVPVAVDPATANATSAAVRRLARWSDNPHQHAYAWARRHPGELYLPWNPLVTLLAEGRLDHSEIGAWNRDLAGVPIAPEQLRRFVPSSARLLATRPRHDATTWLPPPTARLPEFSRRVTEPGLAGWDVHAREGTP